MLVMALSEASGTAPYVASIREVPLSQWAMWIGKKPFIAAWREIEFEYPPELNF